MENFKITFVVFTYNEEKRVEYVLRCFNGYGKILVMDNYSTDKTREIALKYNAEVCLHEHPGWCEEESVANNVLEKVKTPWVYWAFSDEILPKSLLEKLVEVSHQEIYKLVMIPKKNLTYGREKFILLKNNIDPRFFRKGYVSFENNTIHRIGKFLGKDKEILHLVNIDENSIYHCSTYTVEKYISTLNRYSTIEVKCKLNNKINYFKSLVVFPFCKLFYLFFLEGNWRHGYAGFIMSMQFFIYEFLIYSKLWEEKSGISLETIEEDYNRIKEKILNS